jgi:hypothetical protein
MRFAPICYVPGLLPVAYYREFLGLIQQVFFNRARALLQT